MRILFYLPVVTPWWFANIVTGVITALAREHKVHVMVPPLWCGTGIGEAEAVHIEALPHVHWHLLDGPDHPRLRSDASDEDDLIEFVEAIAPDITLCRSADVKTPARFPGAVRFLMEGGAPPFNLGVADLALKHELFDHGFIPELAPNVAHALDGIARELWNDMTAQLDLPTRANFLAQIRLSDSGLDGRRLIGLPLEYEHPESFFGQHHAYDSNADMVRALAAQLGDAAVLVVTHHPLTERHGDTGPVNAAIIEIGGRVKLLSRGGDAGTGAPDATLAMARHCDGMVVGNSKSWSICAALGTPMVRLSAGQTARTAPWVNPYADVASLLRDLSAGEAKCADEALARRWFAHHILNAAFDPADPFLRAEDIIARVHNPADPDRWDHALARYRMLNPLIQPTKEVSYA